MLKIEDGWRVDEGWWRPTPISRLYLRVELEGQIQALIYRDLGDESWWSQLY